VRHNFRSVASSPRFAENSADASLTFHWHYRLQRSQRLSATLLRECEDKGRSAGITSRDLCGVASSRRPRRPWAMAKKAKHRNPKLRSIVSPCSQGPSGNHLRKVALELRDIASRCQFRGARLELRDLAKRFERRADHFDNATLRCSSAGIEQAQPLRECDLVIEVKVVVYHRAHPALLRSSS
jgi:hypothetical protein